MLLRSRLINTLPIIANPKIENMVDYVSATKLKNALINNHFADIIIEHSKQNVAKNKQFGKPPSIQKYNNNGFIMQQGCIFEKEIIKKLYEKFPNNIASLNGNPYSADDVENTKREIQLRTPIILNGVLINHDTKTFGLPDIIIRQDYLAKLFANFPQNIKTSKTDYAIIDIKFCTLPLLSNNLYIKNVNFFPAYKGQLQIYRSALNQITNSNFSYAFILARGIKSCNLRNNDSFSYPGIISYDDYDNHYIAKTNEAIAWVQQVRSLTKLKLSAIVDDCILPKDTRYYPNMKIATDPAWIIQKKKNIAMRCGEITQLWMCGQRLKIQSHSQNVYSWHDSAFLKFLNNSLRDTLIKKIIEINHPNNTSIISKPAKIELPKNNAFLDFEVLSDIIADNAFSRQTIFMIGVGFANAKGVFEYKQFTCKNTSQSEELRICNEFVEYIKKEGIENNNFIHWSRAENWQWQKAKQRLSHDCNLKLFDLCECIKLNQIVVRGAYDFSLKNFAKAMYNNKLIDVSWADDGPANGLDAVFTLHKTMNDSSFDDATIDTIKYYNYIDIKVLHSIMQNL
jgi:hypothetical protein